MRRTRRGIRHEPLYTATEAADLATTWRRLVSAGAAAVTPATIRQWVSRGCLTPQGIDNHRRPLYTRTGIAHAEQTTRPRPTPRRHRHRLTTAVP